MGASDSHIDLNFIKKLKLQKHNLKQPIKVTKFDGRTSDLGPLAYKSRKTISLNSFEFPNFRLLALPLPGNAFIVLEYNFHKLANINVNFRNKVISFRDETRKPTVPPPLPTVALWYSDTQEDIIDPPKPSKFNANWPEEEQHTPPNLEKCLKLVPTKYHNLINVFSKSNAELLPVDTEPNIRLDLVLGSVPPLCGSYRPATAEHNTLKEYIDDMFSRELIRISLSSTALPVWFVPKTGGKLRLCIDYQRLNNMLVKDCYPLPSADMLLDQLSLAKIYTKLDLRLAYHRLRVAKGNR